jgi:hypothetical protein
MYNLETREAVVERLCIQTVCLQMFQAGWSPARKHDTARIRIPGGVEVWGADLLYHFSIEVLGLAELNAFITIPPLAIELL